MDSYILEKAKVIVEIAKAQNLITKYDDWCQTSEADEWAISDDEINN